MGETDSKCIRLFQIVTCTEGKVRWYIKIKGIFGKSSQGRSFSEDVTLNCNPSDEIRSLKRPSGLIQPFIPFHRSGG